jgi:hypothetical protein
MAPLVPKMMLAWEPEVGKEVSLIEVVNKKQPIK